MTSARLLLKKPYAVLAAIHIYFILFALVMDSPANIARGLRIIALSRGILITDYIQLAGAGAAMVNAALVGLFCLALLKANRIAPNGALIMAVWLNTGFALFGKNILNMLPLILGVWLYAKFQKEPFLNFSLAALLSTTLSPIVSEVALTDLFGQRQGGIMGPVVGLMLGFIFPPVAAFASRVHSGYNLYNMGFAAGLISMLFVSGLYSAGITIPGTLLWSEEYNVPMAVFLYGLSAFLLATGLLLCPPGKRYGELKEIMRHPGRLVTDFYLLHKESVYLNMAILCAGSTTLVLLLGGHLNGPTIGGILTIVGFGCFGKHPRNVSPILAGAVLSSMLNKWEVTSPSNMLGILFSTCLAPIAGHFGVFWGIVAGFLHVRVVHHISYLSGGLNLYNNGYAAGFVALFLVPIITAFQKEEKP